MRRILMVLGLFMISFTSGCFWVLDDSPSETSYQYVLDMGDAKKITEWTLKQDDMDKREDGASALLSLIATRNKRKMQTALVGYETIVRARENIPPGTIVGYDRVGKHSLYAEYEMKYYYQTGAFNFDLDELTTILMAIKPKSKYGEYMALWQKEMDFVNEMKSRKTPSK